MTEIELEHFIDELELDRFIKLLGRIALRGLLPSKHSIDNDEKYDAELLNYYMENKLRRYRRQNK